LTALAVLAISSPAVWLALWRGGVRTFAIVAPVLGIARIARAVRRGAVEDEFSRWFQPLDATPGHEPAAARVVPTPGHHASFAVSTNGDGS
jgi:hypothetical protein